MDNFPSHGGNWVLTQKAFDRLLLWLDSDRERAGRRYEEIRLNLIKNFAKYRCPVPEDLADETINRVIKKLPEIEPTYVGDPARYFYAVAYNIYREYLKRPLSVPLPPGELEASAPSSDDSAKRIERMDICLSSCMRGLTPRNREVILRYYYGEKRIKINLRKELAEHLGLTLPALRLLAQRIRESLKKCVLQCLEQEVA